MSYLGAFYFCAFAHYASFMRYTTLLFEARGFKANQIGFIQAGPRILSFIATPLWAALADKTKRARSLLMCSIVASVPFFMLMAFTDSFVATTTCFWLYSLIRTPQGAFMDALALAAAAGSSEKWGKSRIHGATGWGLMHLLMGPLLDSVGFGALYASFAGSAMLYFVICRSAVPEAAGDVKRDVTFAVVWDILSREWLFFMNVGFIGAGFSMVEGMLFLLLREMAAPTWLCGMSVVVTVIFELPIFSQAQRLLQSFGTKRMILIGQLAWVIRALYYAWMPAAWVVLLIEPLHGVTYALVWTAATHHVASPAVSGQGLEATAQGLLSMAFSSLGPTVGLVLGGLLFDSVGSRAAYLFFSVAIGASGLVYALLADDPRSYSALEEKASPSQTPGGAPEPGIYGEPGRAPVDSAGGSPVGCHDGSIGSGQMPTGDVELESPARATEHTSMTTGITLRIRHEPAGISP